MVRWVLRLVSASVVLLTLWTLRPRNTGARPSVTSSAEQRVPYPRDCGDNVIRNQSIGRLRIGMSIDSLKKQCLVVLDTILHGLEGMAERRATVAFPPNTVEAEIVDDRVWRIDVESPAFRTADSLGVGSSVADLLRRDNPDGGTGEGPFWLISRKHCGLSYQLSGALPAGPNRRWDRKALATLAARDVAKVIVWSCARLPGAVQRAP